MIQTNLQSPSLAAPHYPSTPSCVPRCEGSHQLLNNAGGVLLAGGGSGIAWIVYYAFSSVTTHLHHRTTGTPSTAPVLQLNHSPGATQCPAPPRQSARGRPRRPHAHGLARAEAAPRPPAAPHSSCGSRGSTMRLTRLWQSLHLQRIHAASWPTQPSSPTSLLRCRCGYPTRSVTEMGDARPFRHP
jgi:hypothetical protein